VSGAKLNTGSGGVVVGAWLISIVAHGTTTWLRFARHMSTDLLPTLCPADAIHEGSGGRIRWPSPRVVARGPEYPGSLLVPLSLIMRSALSTRFGWSLWSAIERMPIPARST
jgi:hypothetical protein